MEGIIKRNSSSRYFVKQGEGCFPIENHLPESGSVAAAWPGAEFSSSLCVSESPSRFLQRAVCGLQGGSWGKACFCCFHWLHGTRGRSLCSCHLEIPTGTLLLLCWAFLAVETPLPSDPVLVAGGQPEAHIAMTRGARPQSMGREGFKPEFCSPLAKHN